MKEKYICICASCEARHEREVDMCSVCGSDKICHLRDYAAERTAAREAQRDAARERRPVNIIASSIKEKEGDLRRVVSDAIGMQTLQAWEEGYGAAVNVAKSLGATALVEDLEKAREDYWRTQGIEPDEEEV